MKEWLSGWICEMPGHILYDPVEGEETTFRDLESCHEENSPGS